MFIFQIYCSHLQSEVILGHGEHKTVFSVQENYRSVFIKKNIKLH